MNNNRLYVSVYLNANFAISLLSQGCQLLKIAWHEKPKQEGKKKYFNILQFFLRLRLSKLCIGFNFKKVTSKKKKGNDFLDA